MLTKRIIPCLDVKAGRVVKGVKFLDHRDAGDPVEMAYSYDKQGADELVFYDITASSENREIMVNIITKVADQIFIPLTVGGGLRTIKDMRRMLQAGADKVSINTAAVESPQLISEAAEQFGSQCIVLGLDAIRVTDTDTERWEVRIRTGSSGGQSVGLDALDWASRAVQLGVGEIVANSMDKDGTRGGYDIPLLQALSEEITVPVVASGGAGNPQHIYEALDQGKADAALAASILHYGSYTIGQTKEYLHKRGVPIRPS